MNVEVDANRTYTIDLIPAKTEVQIAGGLFISRATHVADVLARCVIPQYERVSGTGTVKEFYEAGKTVRCIVVEGTIYQPLPGAFFKVCE
ncbi:MAG: hypothetical protein ABIE03_02190 [Patescibacteria group bacterium]|nr:hypothetical protein [Patescibacteria group bacterium]